MTQNDFYGPNEGYVLELYERFRRDPESIDSATRAFFAHWTPPAEDENVASAAQSNGHFVPTVGFSVAPETIAGVVNYAQAIRAFGNLIAHLDPLGRAHSEDTALIPESPEAYGLNQAELVKLPASLVGGPVADRTANAYEALIALKDIYTGTIGYDFDHIQDPKERAWLRDAAESRKFRPDLTSNPVSAREMLDRLTQVEVFELFLHRLFPGKFRFSIEGLDVMVPVLDTIIDGAAKSGTREILIGMAHRGRLNVLAHILEKEYRQILAEFKDPLNPRQVRSDLGWTGDVKYHAGAVNKIGVTGESIEVDVQIAPNPSHLEIVNPVVEGMARAAGTHVDHPGEPQFDPVITLPIIIHGDAAFPGQGVVAETLNLHKLPGYTTGGTIHIISNNQLGFTTDPIDSRSTLYASDLAKGFKVPIVHVNADDPEACLEVAAMAFAFRASFHRDFLIDLIGYRRYGHNEVDEPGFTQPMMYQLIHAHKTIRALWAELAIARGHVTQAEADEMVRQRMDALQKISDTLNPDQDLIVDQPEPSVPGAARRVTTSVSVDRLHALNDALLTDPPGFTFHPKLGKARQKRREILSDPVKTLIDWATAEELAFASLLEEGISIRLTGQDVGRGTFSQRHAVFHDYQTDATYVPLQALPLAKAAFEIHDSPLSESAALGFEYGYNVQAPDRLVLWEAQYGDFNNGAQVVIDEFVMSARAKWGQTPSLVMLLPHGLEGSGPDHASARPERFLQLCAEINARVANCTTAAQYFHLLRRQGLLLNTDPLPLIVMTPKSLLRNPLVASPVTDLANGHWMPVLDDVQARDKASQVTRALLCSGKVYVDLVTHALRAETPETALIRVEQLYPFPTSELTAILNDYPNLQEIVWVQEEPQNMGAWMFVSPLLAWISGGRWPVHYVGRVANSSPAEGSPAWHNAVQESIVKRAYGQTEATAVDPLIIAF